jgi:hypothetical protein
MINFVTMFQDNRCKQDLRNASLDTMLRSVDQHKVQGVFVVFRERAASHPQYVVLMRNRSFICTCLILQNVGIVCRHVFLLIRQNPVFKYHISLIPRRWFREMHQGLSNKDLRVQPFLTSDTFVDEASNQREFPTDDYMDIVHALLPSKSQHPVISTKEATRSERYSEMSGKAKAIADMASNRREVYDMVRRELSIIDRKVRAKLAGAEPVEEPQDIFPKGRFRRKRIKSALEGGKRKRVK